MNRPELPLPPLIAALRASASADASSEAAARTVGDALARLADWLGIDGLRLAVMDEDPMRSLEAGCGTLADAPGRVPDHVVRADTGAPLADLWIDGDPTTRDEAVASLEAALLAARAHLSAERAREHLAALDAALRGISASLEVETVLQLIVDRVRNLADAEYAALGIVDEEGVIRRFMTSGIDPELRRRIGSLPRGHGLLGLLVREGRSIRIPDIAADPRRHGFPAHHPEMTSFLGVPITVKGRSIGNLYLTNKRGHAAFSAADQELVERFALHAGIAIEHARLAQQVQQLVVIEERERIGADLHDGVIQRIYGVNLSLDEVPELVTSRPDEAARRVEQAIEALNATIGEIREFIYILRPPGDAAGLGPSLRALAAEVRLQAGLPVEVVSEELPTMAGDEIRELLSIVREALSNAARHASAERAEITARSGPDGLRVTVADDGIGFDAEADHDEQHHGLVNMRRRAERLGGTLDVASRPGAGTRIIVVLPTEQEQTKRGGFGRA